MAGNGKIMTPERRPLSMGDRPSLGAVTTKTRELPNRLLVYAREGWGKTSFAAQAQGCIFLCTKGEDGLDKLIETGQVEETAHFESQAKTWSDVLACINELIVQEHGYRVFVLDTINGAQSMLMRQVVAESFSGKEERAAQFGGIELAKLCAVKWRELLDALDRLREAKRMSILLLSHAEVAKVPNPEGIDFDAYFPSLERKHLWPELARWCDIILFGHVETFAEKESKVARGKATGGTRRLLLTEGAAWYAAKNRHGLMSEIDCGDTPTSAWAAFMNAMKEGRKNRE